MFSGVDIYRPSFFEMIASDRLLPSLKPSLHHLTTILARRHPAFNLLRTCTDELFYALQWTIERHYLNTCDASFSENFYGLKRQFVYPRASMPPSLQQATQTPAAHSTLVFGAEAIQGRKGGGSGDGSRTSSSSTSSSSTSFFRPLSPADRQRALFFLVIAPYLKTKLDTIFRAWKDGVDSDGFEVIYDPTQHTRAFHLLRQSFLIIYPFLHLFYEGGQFLYGLRFLFERSIFYSPALAFTSQVARRMNMDEIMTVPTAAAPTTTVARTPGVLGLIQRILDSTGNWFSQYGKYLLLIGICSFKFLEWWYSPANSYYNAHGPSGKKLPIPPPPTPLEPHPDSEVTLPDDPRLCPLCSQVRSNPAATPTGYVFCYTCIHQHLTNQSTCPITLKSCRLEEIRKIYEN